MEALKFAIGRRLRLARLKLGVNQRSFAEALDTTPNHICQIERGRCIPGGKLLRGMRLHFGININWLLSGMHNSSASSVLNRELQALIANYQRADRAGRMVIGHTARFLAQDQPLGAATTRRADPPPPPS